MATESRTLAPAKVKAGGERIFGYLKGMGVSAMIYLGDRLGLYQALDGARMVTSAELAQKTGLHERWVSEWIRGQAAAGIIDYKGDDRFELSPEIAVFLADSNSPKLAVGIFSDLPQRMAVVERLPQAFKTGIGLNYDARGPEGARGIERVFGNWYRFTLVSQVLPKLDGVVSKLQAGAKAADIGVGPGSHLSRWQKPSRSQRFMAPIFPGMLSHERRRIRHGSA
ncbi:MAG: hypothetical protein JO166_10660 [Deltaproteobacteria bacterium]|nr:hypothetical protein [Deltaproteobacteria bacterium]